MSLTRSGYLTGETQEIKNELTVRAVVNTEFGFPPPPFKVFRKTKTGLCIPRFYGEEKFGKAKEDRRPEPVKISTKFNGKLRDETHQNDALAAARSQIVTLPKAFRGHTTWHRYSDAQIKALRLWILWIAERDGIDVRSGLPALVKEKGADAFELNADAYYGKVKGLFTHTNTRRDKFDMFPQPELMDMLISL